MPAADVCGNSDPVVYNVFSIAPRDGEPHATDQSAASHPDCGAHSNTGNTIETSHADLRDESNLSAAIPLVTATR